MRRMLAADASPPSPAPAPAGELVSIQYLRALAAGAVVLFHRWPNAPLLRSGHHGVDLFFVISGFIMVAVTAGRTAGARAFLADRLARIGPPYWVATLATFACAAAGAAPYAATADVGRLVRSLLFIPCADGQGRLWPTLLSGWTLNYEAFFYLLFAIALLAPARRRLGVLTALLLSLAAAGLLLAPTGPVTSTWTNMLLLEFLAGAALAVAAGEDQRRLLSRRGAAAAFAVAAALLAASVRSDRLHWGAAFVLLLAGAVALERRGRMPLVRPLKQLGDASYAIYLVQNLVFGLVDGGGAWRAGSPACRSTRGGRRTRSLWPRRCFWGWPPIASSNVPSFGSAVRCSAARSARERQGPERRRPLRRRPSAPARPRRGSASPAPRARARRRAAARAFGAPAPSGVRARRRRAPGRPPRRWRPRRWR